MHKKLKQVLLTLLFFNVTIFASAEIDRTFSAILNTIKEEHYISFRELETISNSHGNRIRSNRYDFIRNNAVIFRLFRQSTRATLEFNLTASTRSLHHYFLDLGLTQQTKAVSADNQAIWSYQGLTSERYQFQTKIYDCSSNEESHCLKKVEIIFPWEKYTVPKSRRVYGID